MSATITGMRCELGHVLARKRVASKSASVHVNVTGQQANSLLHDGHAWKDFPGVARSGTRRAMNAAREVGAPMIVHASFAFVHAVEQGAALKDPLRSLSALLAAARPRNAGKVLYATDGHAVSFMKLMDEFAHRVGRRSPLHLPLILKPFAKAIVREEHMQQAALSMPPGAPTPRVGGWRPKYAGYREGIEQVIEDWGN